MPNSSRPGPAYRPLERDVQKAVLAIARGLGFKMSRRNTGGAMLPGHGGKTRLYRFGDPGDSDLYGMAKVGPNRGIHVDLEIKRLGERPTPTQVASLRATIEAGGIALWVDSAPLAVAMLSRILAGGRVVIEENGDQFWAEE